MQIKYFYIILIFAELLTAQNIVQVTFIVEAENVPESSMVYIAGNDVSLGRWAPDGQLLEFIDNKWQKKLQFSKGISIEFKFTRGTWLTEALNDDGSVPSNHRLKVINDTTLAYKINLWADQFVSSEEKIISGQITGTVNYHKNFKGRKIKPRDIVVWLPPGYEENDDKRYPVLYMHDGQNAFDPATSAFGIDWQIDEAADTLIKNKAIEPLIIVGIYNSVERSSEYANNDTGYAYLQFIIEELKPFIDANYRTRPDKNNTAVIGSSLGGLISFILVWEYPEIFSKAACVSPAFKVDRYDYVTVMKNYSGEKKPVKIYLDNGGVGIEEELQPGIDEIISSLETLGYKGGEDYYWFKAKDSEHGEKDWAKRVWRALIFLFGNINSYKLLDVY
ncbi:MAG TPA: alpha/beta hydrolase-fold protein [Ignavibacteriaceae bacterium]|nr:alpha/beta hydrolase-fold protein [Ignavibacteriaceae bacterium]